MPEPEPEPEPEPAFGLEPEPKQVPLSFEPEPEPEPAFEPEPEPKQGQAMEPRSELSLDGTVRMTVNQAGPVGILLHTGATEVKSLREGSQAALAGKVETGSTLSSIETNGRVHDVSKMSYQATMEVLQRGDRPITLSFRLPKSVKAKVPDTSLDASGAKNHAVHNGTIRF